MSYSINDEEKKLLSEAFIKYIADRIIDYDVLSSDLNKLTGGDHWNKQKIMKWFYNKKRSVDSKEISEGLIKIHDPVAATTKQEIPHSMVFDGKHLVCRKKYQSQKGIMAYYECTECKSSIIFQVVNENGTPIVMPVNKERHVCKSDASIKNIDRQVLYHDLCLLAEAHLHNASEIGPHTLFHMVMNDKSVADIDIYEKFSIFSQKDCKRIIEENKSKTKTLSDLAIPEEAAYQVFGGDKVLFEMAHIIFPNEIIMFSNKKQQNIFSNSSNVFIDGTFTEIPKNFKDENGQLLNFLVFDEVSRIYIPVLHVLMKGRSVSSYQQILANITVYFTVNKLTDVFIDFEQSLANAIQNWKPGVKLHQCFFHYSQCLIRKLEALYTNGYNESGKLLIEIMLNLPFLNVNPRKIIIIQMREINSKSLNQMLEYYCSFWIEKDFIPDFVEGYPITNNGCETFHSALSRKINATTPSIITLAKALASIYNESIATQTQRIIKAHEVPQSSSFTPLDIKHLMPKVLDFSNVYRDHELICKCEAKQTSILDNLQSPVYD